MDNLQFYNDFREVPKTAQKPIEAGRLKGMTDINPMWRIKALTEKFGPCGIGWKYTIYSQWMEPGADGVISAFCNIGLQYKWEGEWSEPIPGTGGSAYVAKERNGLYTSDECYKQALTDAVSVAAKALGIGADVYWGQDATKYGKTPDGEPRQKPRGDTQARKREAPDGGAVCPVCHKIQHPDIGKDGTLKSGDEIIASCGGMCYSCWQKGRAQP